YSVGADRNRGRAWRNRRPRCRARQDGPAYSVDGTSNTFMFGEKHVRPNSLRGKNEDRSVFGGQNNSVRRMAGVAPNGDQRPLRQANDQNGVKANESFGGPHSGVCQFVFCDGSVRAIPLSVCLRTLTALAGRDDGLIAANDF